MTVSLNSRNLLPSCASATNSDFLSVLPPKSCLLVFPFLLFPSTMPQCNYTSGDTPTPCTSATYKKFKYCKAHNDEYYGLKARYKRAQEEAEIMGRSLFNASQIHRTPLEQRGHVQAAVNMIMWYVMNIDQEAHGRREQDAKFYGGGAGGSPSLD